MTSANLGCVFWLLCVNPNPPPTATLKPDATWNAQWYTVFIGSKAVYISLGVDQECSITGPTNLQFSALNIPNYPLCRTISSHAQAKAVQALPNSLPFSMMAMKPGMAWSSCQTAQATQGPSQSGLSLLDKLCNICRKMMINRQMKGFLGSLFSDKPIWAVFKTLCPRFILVGW